MKQNRWHVTGTLKFSAFISWLLSCFLLLFAWVGCTEEKEYAAKYMRDFDLDKSVQMDLSDFVDSISIIPLATTDASLIKHPTRLAYVGGRFYINDNQLKILAFDRSGTFLFSTETLAGEGPNEYSSCIDFNVLENGNIEIFDALKYKIREYDSSLHCVKSIELPKQVLPASGFHKISEDICIFEDKASLKFYSLADRQIIKTVQLPFKDEMSTIAKAGLRETNGELYFSNRTPESILYKVDLESMELHPHYGFDFGNKNFDWRDLPEGQNVSFYREYVISNDSKAFVADKFVTPNIQMCFVVYNKRMYFALYDERTGTSRTYYNQEYSKPQLMIPDLFQDNTFYYVCEPQFLDYVLDARLMSSESIRTIESVKEDDNPVIVCYKLK
ncbi:MAG: 6-bladed beta-propeller [Bacteroidales bacterium]|nr:6-bladed beta-propeller [Bacteroidales bacterium]